MGLKGHYAEGPSYVDSAIHSPGNRSVEGSSVTSGGASSAQSFATVRPPLSLTNLFRRGGAFSPDAADSSGCLAERDSLCARVAILGDSDSGRTTVAAGAAKIGPIVHSAADYVSTSAGSAMTYAYRASVSRRREVLRITVLDAGPIPLRGGPSRRALSSCDAVLLTFALTGVKQRHKRGHALFSFLGSSSGGAGGGPPVVIHPRDQVLLRALLASVAARVKRGSRGPVVSLIGTHKKLLSDSSGTAVELVLRELRAICTEAVASLGVPLAVHSVFAVSAVDGSCVSENRGGPENTAAMWAFLCDVLLKGMVSKSTMEGYSEATWRLTFPFPRLYQEKIPEKGIVCKQRSEEVKEGSAERGFDFSGGLSPAATSPVELAINNAYSRLLCLIFHAKSERKNVFLYFENLWRDMYAFGALGKEHLLAVLEQIAATGEIALFYCPSKGLPGRESCICLYPFLIERAQATVYLYASYARDQREDRGKLLTGIDLNACRRLDACNDAARGVFSQSILYVLTPRIRLPRVPPITVEIFALLLLHSDTAFVRRSRRPLASQTLPKGDMNIDECNSSFCLSKPSADGAVSAPECIPTNNSVGVAGKFFNSMTKEDDSASVPKWELTNHLEFVLPALIESECPRELVCCARRLASSSDSALHGYFAASCLLGLRDVPLDFFPLLTCRINPYVDPTAPMYGQALWLNSNADASHAVGGGGGRAESNVLLRAFVALTRSANGESLLEMHTFCEGGGSLPVALLMSEVTGHVAQLLERDFPSVAVRVISELPGDVKDARGGEREAAGGSFLSVSTVRELDSAIRGASII